MITGFLRVTAAMASALALAGCMGGGGGGGGGGASTTTYVVDRNSYAGTGYAGDPYVMPSVTPANTTGGFDDYFASAAGFWQVRLSSKYIATAGNTIAPPSIGSALIYDSVADTWTVNIGGTNYVLTWNAIDGNYFCDVAGGTCTPPADTNFGMGISNATMTKYGRFAAVWYEMDNVTDSSGAVLLGHTGPRTETGNMPTTGTATYTGDAFAFLDRGAKKQSVQANGTATVTADFAATVNNISLTGSLAMDATGVLENGEAIYGAAANAALTGTGTISGNEFTGTLSAALTGMAGAADTTLTGSMAGAFYGPAADEVVGYFDAGGTVTTTSFGDESVQLLGGFATVKTP